MNTQIERTVPMKIYKEMTAIASIFEAIAEEQSQSMSKTSCSLFKNALKIFQLKTESNISPLEAVRAFKGKLNHD